MARKKKADIVVDSSSGAIVDDPQTMKDLGGEFANKSTRQSLSLGTMIDQGGYADELEKSQRVFMPGGRIAEVQDPKDGKPVSRFFDPLFVLDFLQYKTKNTSWAVSYALLRKMSYRNGVISSIINTRLSQVSMFSSPYLTPNDRIGYTVYPKDKKYQHLLKQSDGRFEIKPISQEEVAEVREVMEFLEFCGLPSTRDIDPERDMFGDFLKKIVRDSLTFDQLCFEITRDPSTGKPKAFYAVDASTIRLADPKTKKAGLYYVQWINGQIYAAYNHKEMAFCVRNPLTDLYANGYGISEIEMALNYIAAQLFAEDYNRRFFTQGSTPKGLLNIRGSSIPQDEFEAFKRAWYAQVSGVGNAWKTPIVASEGIDWVNLGQSNREMEYGRWLEYLVNIICGVYQIDPVEINFPNRGGAGQGGKSLSDSSMVERIKFSKDKGLVPLLKFLEKIINKYIVYPLTDNKLEFSFYGYTDVMDSMKISLEKQEVEYFATVNEIRAQYGRKPLPGGDIILNATYTQYQMQREMQAQQDQTVESQSDQKPQEYGDATAEPADFDEGEFGGDYNEDES